jgi:hypothetical protein
MMYPGIQDMQNFYFRFREFPEIQAIWYNALGIVCNIADDYRFHLHDYFYLAIVCVG